MDTSQLKNALEKKRDENAKLRLARNHWRAQFITLALVHIPDDKRDLIPADYDDEQRARYILNNLNVLTKSDV